MWIVFSYLLSYIDKLLILRNLGSTAQGNYQAIFDLLFRGITVLISPVIISMLPLLTQAYEKGEISEIKNLMKKIILFEIGGLFLCTIFYWWFGASLLFKMLKIPDTEIYRVMGFIILAGTFAWQISMVIHQQYILKLKSRFLLLMIFLAFLIQIAYYWFIADPKSPISYPLGYFFAAVAYLFLISLSSVFNIINPRFCEAKCYSKIGSAEYKD
jgi:O-antigen/teichoic acid export membrane protein